MYNISSFMRDFLIIKEQTFKVKTVTYAFINVGLWLVSSTHVITKL
jgi:hypothetical protein